MADTNENNKREDKKKSPFSHVDPGLHAALTSPDMFVLDNEEAEIYERWSSGASDLEEDEGEHNGVQKVMRKAWQKLQDNNFYPDDISKTIDGLKDIHYWSLVQSREPAFQKSIYERAGISYDEYNRRLNETYEAGKSTARAAFAKASATETPAEEKEAAFKTVDSIVKAFGNSSRQTSARAKAVKLALDIPLQQYDAFKAGFVSK